MYHVRRLLRNPQVTLRISQPLPRDSSSVTIRHLQIKRPWARRFLATFLLCGTTLHFLTSFAILRFDESLYDTDRSSESLPEPDASSTPGKCDRNEYVDQAVTIRPRFLPLGWPRLYEGDFYTATDPEWQAFRKLALDKNKVSGLKDELISTVLDVSSQSRLLPYMLGGPLSVAGAWLEHQFPYRAPPVYHQFGLELSPNGLAWGSKPMPAEDGDCLHRCMRPLCVAHAIKDAFLMLWSRQISRLSPRLMDEQMSGSLIPVDASLLPSILQGLDGLDDVPRSVSQPPAQNYQDGSPSTKDCSHPHTSLCISTLQKLPLPNLGPGSDLRMALLAFKWRLNYCWAHNVHTSHRGVMYFSGPVGIRGPKGLCRVEVKGEYDVMRSQWTAVSMDIRDLNLFSQRALGPR
ncbi:hypothetical protein ASPBRDRAFT_54825 [Aspergillus brasiliensis CBS 101740]|uniref:Uncharacterized protein n=1 Tax=Aspergillus brasiliensis (strain CBS 101740 / IMI 381727 / IBT 21946) TaxID=767769 RepID=A0A1L9UIP4_ASPBC|nr:hypothetical protein ASPBRDRAFT_54825 [Aspergillus brasiliensis CBS 101740]